MIALIPLGAIVLSAVLQGILRGGAAASEPAPNSMKRGARIALSAGVFVTVAPLLPLATDLFAAGSFGEIAILAGFIVVSIALILPAWLWTHIVGRAATRSAVAFVIATSAANFVVALVMYRGLFSGVADSQDGIVLQMVPLMQLIVTGISVLVRKLLAGGAGSAQRSATATR